MQHFDSAGIISSSSRVIHPIEPNQLVAAAEKRAARNPAIKAELRPADRAVVVHQKGRSGMEMRVAVPYQHFLGVSVAIDVDEAGTSASYRVLLIHEDPNLEVVLFEAQDDEEILAQWHKWRNALNLPLLMRTEEGDVAARGHLGPLQLERASPRRARGDLVMRRTRFSRRREIGEVTKDTHVIRGEREIIARS